MPYLAFLTTVLVTNVLAGCANRGDAVLEQSQPATKQAAPSPKSGGKADPQKTVQTTDFEAVIRELGAPVIFDQVFAEVQGVPRFKDEFETAAQFTERQAAARAKCKERYLIAAPVDPEHVRYDADKQVLIVETYALTNTLATSDELGAVFGYGSELSKAKAEVKYTTLSSGNVMWIFPRERKDVGTYDGANAFGVKATITKQEGVSRGVFERQGAYEESVWVNGRQPYVKGSPPVAFEIKADLEKAKALKQSGLRAAILVVPKAPFYATGVDHFTPTIQAPYDRTTSVRYLVGDIQCAAIYDSEGKLLATRPTQ